MDHSRLESEAPRALGPFASLAVPARRWLHAGPWAAALRDLAAAFQESAQGILDVLRADQWSALRPHSRAAASRRKRTRRFQFQPMVDAGLETRALLSSLHAAPLARPHRAHKVTAAVHSSRRAGFHSPFGKNYLAASSFLLRHPSARMAYNLKAPPFLAYRAPHFNNVHGFYKIRYIGTQTARGGQAVEVTARDGSHYMIKLSYMSNTIATAAAEGADGQLGVGSGSSGSGAVSQVSQQSVNYPQPIGVVRAYPMRGGRVGIIVDGSTPNTDLTINPMGQPQRKGYAHSFAYGEAGRTHVLNIGQLTVTSGTIGAIEGYQVAKLSGPLQVSGSASIGRIALDAITPGASITTGGDVQTLDVLHDVDLSGAGTGITIGRDLNLLNVGGDLTLSNGANFQIDRNLGLVSQPARGTGTGSNVLSLNFTNVTNSIITTTIPSVGSFIQGSLNINPGSQFTMSGNIFNTMYVEGTVNGYSRLIVNYGQASQTNPPGLTSLTFDTLNPPPSTKAGPAPAGYVTAIGGIVP